MGPLMPGPSSSWKAALITTPSWDVIYRLQGTKFQSSLLTFTEKTRCAYHVNPKWASGNQGAASLGKSMGPVDPR